jgi:6-phosphogluconolactonase (cycloisomerase 2 family)
MTFRPRLLALAVATFLAHVPARGAEFSWLQVDAEPVERGALANYRDPVALAVSPDGRHVYGSDHYFPGSLAVFERDATTGALRVLQVIPGWDYNNPVGPSGPLLSTAISIRVSPDGRNVYVAAYYATAVTVFARDATSGLLTFVQVVELLDGLGGATSIVLSPDGAHLYVSGYHDNAIAMFARSTVTGELSYLGAVRDGEGGIVGLAEPAGLVMSPGGEHVYAAAAEGNAVFAFDRDAGTGLLTLLGAWRDGDPGIDSLGEPYQVALSPDGLHLYAASQDNDAITVFARTTATGQLTPIGVYTDGIVEITGPHDRQLIVTPDGATVLAVNSHGLGQAALLFLDRDPGTGLLSFRDEIVGGPIAESVWNLAMSPGGETLYAGLLSTAVVALRAPTVACDDVPRSGCRAPTPGRSRLVLREDPAGVHDALRWKWRGGGTTPPAFEDPVATPTDFALCLYAGGVSRAGALARGGAQCGRRACWRTGGGGRLTYSDRSGSPSGLGKVKLVGSAAGDGQLTVTGKGQALPEFGLPFGPVTIRAQLVSASGECWDSTFSPPHDESDPTRFSESSD